MNNNNHKVHSEESLIVSAIKSCFLHWPVFLIFSVITALGSLTFVKLAPVYYQANALLIIKDEKKVVRNLS